MAKLGCMLVAIVVFSACSGVTFRYDSGSSPEPTPYELQARLLDAGDGYYVAYVDIQNSSSAPLALAHDMFSLEAPHPVFFVPAYRIRWGRSGFRLPGSVAAGAHVSGEVCFGIRGGTSPTSPVGLVVRLPDGQHRFVFDVE